MQIFLGNLLSEMKHLMSAAEIDEFHSLIENVAVVLKKKKKIKVLLMKNLFSRSILLSHILCQAVASNIFC